ALTGEVHTPGGETDEGIQAGGASADVREVGDGEERAVPVGAGGPDPDQPGGIAEGERADQHALDAGGDDGVGRDAQGERRDDAGGERRSPGDAAWRRRSRGPREPCRCVAAPSGLPGGGGPSGTSGGRAPSSSKPRARANRRR